MQEKEYALYNKRYDRFFKYFYDAIYKDKYYVMGDYDTMTIAFLLDTALYYFAAIMPIYRWSHERLGVPPFFEDGAEIGYYPIRFYNRRLVEDRAAQDGARHLRQPQRRQAAQVRRLLGARGHVGHALPRPAALGKAELANAWTYVVKPRPIGKPAQAPPRRRAARRPAR